MNRAARKAAAAYLRRENKRWPDTLVKIPPEEWPYSPPNLVEAWRSRDFVVQVYQDFRDSSHHVRLSICRTSVQSGGRWQDQIAWDDLQRLKRECGFGQFCAVEIYPPEKDVVNVANMRHLWVLDKTPEFMWRSA